MAYTGTESPIGDYHRKDSGGFRKTLKMLTGFVDRLRKKKKKKRKYAAISVAGVRG